MSGMISRQTAISAICNACGKIDCDKMDKCEKLQLPPANCSEIPNNSDTISRQAAIEALEEPCKVPDTWTDEYAVGERTQWEKDVKALNSLPSAQPEIVRCKDCKLFGNSEQLPSAQPEQRWIPCSERLPEKDGKYQVTRYDYVTNTEFIDILWYEENLWWNRHSTGDYAVTAWMPLPEPYRGGGAE